MQIKAKGDIEKALITTQIEMISTYFYERIWIKITT